MSVFLVARTPVGKTVKVKVIRDKSPQHFDIKIAELKEEEVAQAVLWLCSPAAGSVNSQAIAISGGQS